MLVKDRLQTQRHVVGRFAVFLAVTLSLFWTTVLHLASTVWNVETFSHGILIPGIVMWLVWRNRQTIFDAPHQPSWLALGGVAMGATVWFVGKLVDFKVVQNFGLVGVIISGWAVCAGIHIFKKSLFPALFLLFVVPFGTFLDQPLMQATADITVRTLRVLGVPVFQDGLQFKLPTGNWSVIEACSGLRYLLASIILGCLFSYLNFKNWTKRLGFILLCILVALIANWIRAVTVVLVGHFSEMRLGTGDDHVWYGWVFFGLVMYAVFYFANRFTEENSPVPVTTIQEPIDNIRKPSGLKLWSPIVIAILLVASARLLLAGVVQNSPRADFFPANLDILSFSKVESLAYEPDYASSVSTLKLKMTKPQEYELFAAYYVDQANRGKMITGENSLVKLKGDWKIISFDQPAVGTNDQTVYEAIVQQGSAQRLVFYWYQFENLSTPNRYIAGRAQLIRALKFQSDEAVFVAVSTPVTQDINSARGKLLETSLEVRKILASRLQKK
jgi:exosortase A